MAKKQSYVGIDLGGSTIKAVELIREGNRPKLVTYGFIEDMPNIVKDDSEGAKKTVVAGVKEVMKRAKISTNKAIASLPGFSVFSSIINLPVMAKKDLISAVRWEAKKFVPIPLEEMILDWELLKEPGQSEAKESELEPKEKNSKEEEETKDKEKSKTDKSKAKDNKVLLTAAPKNLVERYVDIFKRADLQLVGLETEAFALERSLIGNERASIMIIDVGQTTTSLIIFTNGVPIINRGIDVGGRSITEALTRITGLDYKQAEQFKRDYSNTLTGKNIDQMPKPISFVANSIINETRYILNIYQGQNKQPIEKIIFSGGSAFLSALTEQVGNIFEMKVFIGDPWARVIYPVDLESMLKEIGPRFTVAIGLAMREIVQFGRMPLNIIKRGAEQ